MLPIEPGCLAVVVNCVTKPERNGRVVTVGRFLGRANPQEPTEEYWEIKASWICAPLGGMALEVCLLRIDGYTETEELAQEVEA